MEDNGMEPVTSSDYASVDPMSTGQMRRLIEVAASAMPSDLLHGTAQWLADRALRTGIEKMIRTKRREWLSAHSGLGLVTEFRFDPLAMSSLTSYLRGRRHDNRIRSELSTINNDRVYDGPGSLTVYLYEADRSLAYEMANECGLVSCPGGNLLFNPMHLAGMLDAGLLDPWRKSRMMFLASSYRETTYYRVKAEPDNDWNLGLVNRRNTTPMIEEGSIVAFREPLF